jgi:uncharacterized protein (TIGR03118 family)
MRFARTAIYGVIGAFSISVLLVGCGGSGSGGLYGGSTASTPIPAAVTVKVSPASVAAGQSATITWSSNSGTSCVASGAWSGTQPATGSSMITATAAGSETFSLACTGGVYSSGSGSATLTVTAPAASAVAMFTLTNLVAGAAGGTAKNVDPKLVNPWGLSIAASDPAWIANNQTNTSTLYDGNGKAQPAASQIIASFSASSAGAAFAPTGIVYNASSADFIVTSGATSSAALYIFDGEGGMIAGWSPTVSVTNAVTVYTDTGGAVYTGLAIATNAGSAFLYAADFHNGKIDVFNSSFAKQTTSATSFTFADPAIPAGFAPFGIQAINNGASGAAQIYVTYAQQSSGNNDATNGAGQGYVDVYDTNGQLIKQLIPAGGALNAPWGIALAPANFGTFSDTLLVGNFGDGKINAFDAAAGTAKGTVSGSSGAALVTPGLWGLAFGNGADNQPLNTLFFTAGGANGVYGRIDLGATPPTLDAPPAVTLTAPSGTLSGTVVLSATVVDPIAITKVDFYANSTLIGTAASAPYTINWNTTTLTTGSESVSLSAKATDADGNVGSSPASTTTVNNGPAPVGGY